MPYSLASPKRQFWITQLIGIVCFIAVPVLVTMLIPASWVSLTRDAQGRVSATARTCVLFMVPWRVQHLEEVTGIEAHTIRGDRLVTQRSRSYSSPDRGSIHSDGEAELVVSGRAGEMRVKISPASVEARKAGAQAFLQDAGQRHLRFFTIANWKFGLGFGIPLTLMAALYLIGSTLAILRRLFRALKQGFALRGPSKM